MNLSPSAAEQIVAEAPDALLLIDGAGLVTYVNGAVTRLFGYEPADLVGRSVETLVPERFRDVHQRYRGGFAAAPTAREMGARLVNLSARRRDGSEIPVEIRLAPIKRPEGPCVVVAVRDVSDRRRMTEELNAAREAADAANRSKSRFLATASHDLRQPLQTLQLLNAALARQVRDPAGLDIVDRQERALRSMGDLLNTLLDVSRLESGTVRPVIAPVSMGELLTDLRREFEEIAAARGLTLFVDDCAEAVLADRVLLRQMIQNLLTNALQYTRVGSVRITVRREPERLLILVADTGVGIPKEQLSHIFDEYYRVEQPGEARRGFGLGLTIVRQLGRLLGFNVEVDSEVGRGTTFRLSIPAERLTLAMAPLEKPAPALATIVTMPKPAVLVVEDDDAVRGALELVLKVEGYPVLVAGSAEAAVAVFDREGPNIDLLVTDFHLNGPTDGLKVLDALRRKAGRELPAVVLSGDTSPILDSLGDRPQVQLLRKPVDARQLVQRLEDLFGHGDPGAP